MPKLMKHLKLLFNHSLHHTLCHNNHLRKKTKNNYYFSFFNVILIIYFTNIFYNINNK